jgi:hypothetical protein
MLKLQGGREGDFNLYIRKYSTANNALDLKVERETRRKIFSFSLPVSLSTSLLL